MGGRQLCGDQVKQRCGTNTSFSAAKVMALCIAIPGAAVDTGLDTLYVKRSMTKLKEAVMTVS